MLRKYKTFLIKYVKSEERFDDSELIEFKVRLLGKFKLELASHIFC